MIKEFYIMDVLGVISGMNFSGMDGIYAVIRHCTNEESMTDMGYVFSRHNASKIILKNYPDLLEDFKNQPLEYLFQKYSNNLKIDNFVKEEN